MEDIISYVEKRRYFGLDAEIRRIVPFSPLTMKRFKDNKTKSRMGKKELYYKIAKEVVDKHYSKGND